MPVPAPEIEALEVRGRSPVRLSAQRGQVVLVSFGYASCAGVCPRTLAKVKVLLDALGPEAARVRVFFVSIDPARDTPERFRAFLDGFDPRIEGLFIEPARLGRVLEAYQAVAIKQPVVGRRGGGRPPAPGDYSFEHSAAIWLIDARGDLREKLSATSTTERLTQAVRSVIRER